MAEAPAAKRSGAAVAHAITAVVLVVVGGYFLWLSRGPITTARGDISSDAHVLMSSRHFHEDGFARCRFLPVVQPGELTDPPYWHLHQPPGVHILGGFARSFGVRTVQAFRVLPVMLTVLGCALFYAFAYRTLGRGVAVCALFFLATTPALLYWADALGSYAFDHFFRFAAMAAWIYAITTPSKTGRRFRKLAGLAWAATFAEAACSMRYAAFLQVFFWGSAYALEWRGKRRLILFMLSAPAAAFFLHAVQNATAIGFAASIEDWRRVLLLRSFEIGATDGTLDLAEYPTRMLERIEHWYMSVPQLLAFWVLGALGLRRFSGQRLCKQFIIMTIVLWAAGAIWWIVFPQQTWSHHDTIQQALPVFALIVGAAFYYCYKLATRPYNHPALRVIAGAFLAFLLMWQGHRVALYTQDQQDASDFAEELTSVKAALPEEAVVVTNHGNHPMLAYLIDRPVFFQGEIDRIDTFYPGRPLAVLRYDPDSRQAPFALRSLEARILPDGAAVSRHADFLLFAPE